MLIFYLKQFLLSNGIDPSNAGINKDWGKGIVLEIRVILSLMALYKTGIIEFLK